MPLSNYDSADLGQTLVLRHAAYILVFRHKPGLTPVPELDLRDRIRITKLGVFSWWLSTGRSGKGEGRSCYDYW